MYQAPNAKWPACWASAWGRRISWGDDGAGLGVGGWSKVKGGGECLMSEMTNYVI